MMNRISHAAAVAAAILGLAACTSQRVDTAATIDVPKIQRPAGETPDWWFRAGAAAAQQASREANASSQHARNVIIFLGDGMSVPTVAAAHILAGQRQGKDGESYRLAFEQFPFTAMSRTYETNQQTPDSAGTMSAIMTGVKTRAGVISVDQVPARGDCPAVAGHERVTLLELAKTAGMAVGAVSTARITHATPAATYAHLPERNWEVDADIPEEVRGPNCHDIAAQLIDMPQGGLDVAMGGGRTEFMPAGAPDPEYPQFAGRRLDGRDLVGEWRKQHPQGAYVWNQAQFKALDLKSTHQLLGLFEPSHMQYEHDRPQDGAGEPSLAEMTRTAIRVLRQRPNGFVLMVEGGRIDHALHAGNAYRALDETIAMDEAVKAAMEETDPADTLIVVTADHSHTMTFAGYPVRGNPILGLVHGVTDSYMRRRGVELAYDALGQPYTTLGFASGPGYTGATDRQPEGAKHFPHTFGTAYDIRNGRPDLAKVDTTDPDFMQEATHPLKDETHGGEDVMIFARGPGAASFHGELEQNAIFHVIAQHTPRLREQLCTLGSCSKDGMPVRPPTYSTWREEAMQEAPRSP